MRRRFVSDEDLDTVISLRKSGAGWLKIQEVTGIPRRTAKRVYDEWQQSRAAEEVTTARRQVAAEAFNSHMRDLVKLAHEISAGLATPGLADRRDGTQVLGSIFEADIHGNGQDKTHYPSIRRDVEDIKRQNRVLFDSLKEHTKDTVNWQTLADWQVARDEWKMNMERLESTAAELVRNILNYDTDSLGLSSRIKSDKRLLSKMALGVAEATQRNVTTRESDEATDYIKVKKGVAGTQVMFGGDASDTELVVDSLELAEKVAMISRRAATNLDRGKESYIVRNLADSLFRMDAAHRELVDKLDELRLTPLILRTRCEICPA